MSSDLFYSELDSPKIKPIFEEDLFDYPYPSRTPVIYVKTVDYHTCKILLELGFFLRCKVTSLPDYGTDICIRSIYELNIIKYIICPYTLEEVLHQYRKPIKI